MIFPNFLRQIYENVREILDILQMKHLIFGRDIDEVKFSAFPLVLKEEAKTWYGNLLVMLSKHIGMSSHKPL